MYVVDGIAYAGEESPLLKVVGVKPMEDYRIWLRFSNDEERVYDVKPLFKYPVFAQLQDRDTFASIYLDHGVPTWLDGEIDIAPESLFENSTAYQKSA
jgi:hypothetical protein